MSGDHHPQQDNDCKSLNHGFAIEGSPTPRDIYLRQNSTSTILAYAQVLTVNQANTADQRQELLYTLYLGLITAFMVWALLEWLKHCEVLIAVFLVKQFMVLAHALAFQGYLPLLLGEHFSGPSTSNITALIMMAYVLSSAAFLLLLLGEFQPVPWLWWPITAIQAAYLPMMGLFLWDEIRLALQINISLATLTVVGVLLMALSTLAWQDKTPAIPPPLPLRVLIGFAVAQLLVTFSSTLTILNGVNAPEWSLDAPILGGFVNSLLMIVLLSLRARNLEKQHQKMLLESTLFKQQAQTEREQREEQARFWLCSSTSSKPPCP